MIKNIIFVLISSLSFVAVFAQKNNKTLQKADDKYNEMSFIEARNLYSKLVKAGYESGEVYARLADTYFFNADYPNALTWYTKCVEKDSAVQPVHHFRYAVCLKAGGRIKESKEVFQRYYAAKEKSRGARITQSDKNRNKNEIEIQSGRYSEVGPAGVNSPLSGYGITLIPNADAYRQMIEDRNGSKREKRRLLRENAVQRQIADGYKMDEKKHSLKKTNDKPSNASGKPQKADKYTEVIYAKSDMLGREKRKNKWHMKSFSSLYTAKITKNGMLEKEEKLLGEINSQYSESTPAVTKDGMTMYFTRLVPYFNQASETLWERANDKKRRERKQQISQLKLFRATKKNDKWVNVAELPFPLNMEGSSSAHPALSPNDDFLYFVSNRDKQTNDTDIYVVKRKPRGGFDYNVQPLGEEINTAGRETFPFVDANGILFFASDGLPGMGGLDVFAAARDSKGKYVVVNAGEPINSKSDDFGYVIDADSKKGYFSSDRDNEASDDALYRFKEDRPIVFPFKLFPKYFGTVKDTLSNRPIAGVEVKVYNEAGQMVKTLVTKESGDFFVELPANRQYSFVSIKSNYQVKKTTVKAADNLEDIEMVIQMFQDMAVIADGKVVDLKEGSNLAHLLKISALYFDYGGYNIRKSTISELDKVIAVLKKNTSISVEVRCHTDSRGRDEFNLKLSRNRAKTIMDYITEVGGIARDRISGEGYGENELLNSCSNGVQCTASEHGANRRTDFIVHLSKND